MKQQGKPAGKSSAANVPENLEFNFMLDQEAVLARLND